MITLSGTALMGGGFMAPSVAENSNNNDHKFFGHIQYFKNNVNCFFQVFNLFGPVQLGSDTLICVFAGLR